MSLSNQTTYTCPQGVHLVGSIRLPTDGPNPGVESSSVATVLQTVAEALPDRLWRIPDGEVGVRHYFANWQEQVFITSPWIMAEREVAGKDVPPHAADPERNKDREIVLGPPGYDEVAVASYMYFRQLRDKGVIHRQTRFQVSIPTPVNAVTKFVKPEFRQQVEGLYRDALLQAVRNIQLHIPAEDLAIQWDSAVEFAMLERWDFPPMRPWFDPTLDAIAGRILPFINAVNESVQVGSHLCYGDLGHKHFVQPKDMSKLVEIANRICAGASRPINWVHMPVPQDRKDDAYFTPLNGLKLHNETYVFLGLVHPHDEVGTRERIEVARKYVKCFGVATECGMGRTPIEDTGSIFQILKQVSNPIGRQA